ncbi:LOW QUALITY PROTEIN: hypothetical protein HZS_6068 [Henneguya salminicola]|nr:LOW QUALITY PROTEIN: hypothetical protein HZS_6068 [Henneguya salminicola]
MKSLDEDGNTVEPILDDFFSSNGEYQKRRVWGIGFLILCVKSANKFILRVRQNNGEVCEIL